MQDPVFLFDSKERWFPVAVPESLALHGYRWEQGDFYAKRTAVDCLDFPPDMEQPDLPPVGYKRGPIEREGLLWYQWWLWYLYNPKQYAGVGAHEGDWEFVQVATTPEGKPVLMSCSQHQSGGRRDFWKVEQVPVAARPVVYVARDSHANYFSPQRDREDVADGRGRPLQIEWHAFGKWSHWEGRWGNSRGRGNSPESPAQQGNRWHQPHLYHSSCR